MYQALVLLLAQNVLQMLLANPSITNFPNDIGSLFKPSMSTIDIVSIVNQEQNYILSRLIFFISQGT